VLHQLDEAVEGGQALEAGFGELEAGAVEPVALGQDGDQQLLLLGKWCSSPAWDRPASAAIRAREEPW
jgi:hypothetical protein